MKKFLLFMFGLCVSLNTNAETVPGITYPFSLTTTEIAVDGTFKFMLSASGTFYVDCGTGGNLSSDDSTANAMISGGTIAKTNTTNYTFKCAYSTAGTKTIQFGGEATAYNTGTTTAAISFSTDATHANSLLVSSISGNLSVIFPYLGHASGQVPRFYQTFALAKITSIPETLFANYIGDLSGASYMFYRTFYYVYIGYLTQIPENLFSGITVAAPYMFYGTFNGCVFLTSIPENLFANITNSAKGMFFYTFYDCSYLKSLPKRLFSHFTTAAPSMFQGTFEDCRDLRGYVPPTLFAGLIANNSPYATDMMTNIFGFNIRPANNLDISCPNGTSQVTTGYEQYWETGNGIAVSCEPNTLNVNWYNESTQLSVGSESQSCVYGDYITVPTVSATKPGYHFGGWKVKQ